MNWLQKQTYKLFTKALGNILPYRSYMWGRGATFMGTDQETLIKDGYMANLALYSIINKIVKSVSSIPFNVYEVKGGQKSIAEYNRLTKYSRYDPSKLNTKALQHKAKEFIEVQDHEVLELLAHPNPNQSQTDFVEEALAYRLITGNRYIYGAGPKSGLNKDMKKELYILPSQIVKINVDGSGQYTSYEFWNDPNGKKIETEKILHQKKLNPDVASYPYGMSPIQAGSKAVTLSNDGYTASASLMQRGGANGIISGAETQFQQGFTSEQAAQLKEKLVTNRTARNYGELEVTSLPVSWTEIGMNAVDLKIIESNKMTFRDLCNLYSVASELFNDPEGSTYNNVKEAKKALYTESALPELYNLIDGLNRWLMPQYVRNDSKTYFLDCDITVIPELQEDLEKMVNQLSQAWWLTPNEKRIAMSYDEDTTNIEMGMYWTPANLVPMGSLNFSEIHTEEDETNTESL